MSNEVEYLRIAMERYPDASIDQLSDYACQLMASYSQKRIGMSLNKVHATTEDAVSPAVAPSGLKVSPKNAIQADKIVCCVCGFESKTLTKGHLAEHGLTRDAYLDMCGYAKNTKLMCLDQIAARKEKVRETKPWEKTKRWQEKQAQMRRETADAAGSVGSGASAPVKEVQNGASTGVTEAAEANAKSADFDLC